MASHSKQAYVEDASDSEADRRTQANVAAKRSSYSSDLRGKAHEAYPASSSSSPPPPASSSSAVSSSSHSSPASSSSRQASHPSERPREPRIDSGYSSRNSANEDSADSEQSTKSEKTALPPKSDAEGASPVKKSKRPMKVELKQEKAESSRRESPTKPSRTESVREKRPKDRDQPTRKDKADKAEARSRSDRPERKEKERERDRDRGKERDKERERERDPERERERQERKREREREREKRERELERERQRERGRERADRPDRQARGRAPSVRGDRERSDYPPQNYAPPSPNPQRRVQYAQPPHQPAHQPAHQPQPEPEYTARRPRAASITRPRPESWYGQQLDPYALGMAPYPPPGPPPSKSAFINMSMQQQPFPYGGTTPPNQGFLQPHVHPSPVSPYDPIRPPLATRKTDGEALSARRPSSLYGAPTPTVISYPESSITERQPQLSMRQNITENDIGPSARYTSGSAATNPLLLADQPYNGQDDDDEDDEDDYSEEEEDDFYDEHNYMIASAVLGEGEYDRRAMPPPPRPGLRPHQPRSHTANDVFDLHRQGQLQLVPIDSQSRSSRSNSNSNPNISRRGSISSGRKSNSYAVPSNTGATRIITVESNARPRRRMSYAAREQRAREVERIPREYREYRDTQGRYHERDFVERDTDGYAVRDRERDRDQRRARAHTATATPSEVEYRTRNKLTTADAYQRAANEQAGNPMPLTAENIKRRSVNVHLPSLALASESGSAQTSRSSNSRGKTPAISPMNMLPSNASALGALNGLEGIKMQIRPDGITLISGHENRTVELKHGEDGHAMLTLGDLQDELIGATSRLGFDDTRSKYTSRR